MRHFIALAVLLLTIATSSAEDEPVRAGEMFSGAKGWLGTAEPLTNDKLKGQVVLVDFWTYCCINCMHVIPELKFLEEKYKDQPFVVVGVHSGKFDQEKDIANIRAAVLRNGLKHPVAVDSDFAIWNRFGVRSWPTLVLIGSDGKPVGSISGEGHRDLLDKVIAKTLAEGKANGTLAAKPLVFTPEVDATATGPLSFPGKVMVDAARKRLFIADTGHNRVLIAGLDGAVTTVIGFRLSNGFEPASLGSGEKRARAFTLPGSLWQRTQLSCATTAIDCGGISSESRMPRCCALPMIWLSMAVESNSRVCSGSASSVFFCCSLSTGLPSLPTAAMKCWSGAGY